MRTVTIAFLAGLALVASGCSGRNSSGANDCGGCPGGQLCVDGTCEQVCNFDSDCADSSLICGAESLCVEGARTTVPMVTGIVADGSANTAPGELPNHVESKVTIQGANFEGASVTLVSATGAQQLEVCSASATELVAVIPAALEPGTYTLRVASQAGACDTTLPALRGEKGDKGDTGAPGVPCSGCVDAGTIAANAVTAGKIAGDAVTGAEVADGSLGFADIGDNGCAPGEYMRMASDGTWHCSAGESCTTVTISNRDGNTWKYGRFELPYECQPPFMDSAYPTAAPHMFGCTVEMWVEHHSSNLAGYWRGMRSAKLAIWPNGENTGRAYLQLWDYGAGNVYDIQSGPGEILLQSHWYDMCRFTDSYWNGATWTQTTRRAAGGWKDLGIMATAYTRCTLRFCEERTDPGTYVIAERTSGPLTD